MTMPRPRKKFRKLKNIHRQHRPLKTERYCAVCGKFTQFEYNRNICHSECKECGGRTWKTK